jgi:hypothetical protein
MNITSIALDDLIAAFADALAEANYQIAEKHGALQNQMREENGPALSLLLPNKALRIKSGSITVTAQPIIKEEKGRNGKETRIYLKFGGINKKELTFEVALEK